MRGTVSRVGAGRPCVFARSSFSCVGVARPICCCNALRKGRQRRRAFRPYPSKTRSGGLPLHFGVPIRADAVRPYILACLRGRTPSAPTNVMRRGTRRVPSFIRRRTFTWLMHEGGRRPPLHFGVPTRADARTTKRSRTPFGTVALRFASVYLDFQPILWSNKDSVSKHRFPASEVAEYA